MPVPECRFKIVMEEVRKINRTPRVRMFFNPDVSIEEEIYQAKFWKQAQQTSERRARKLVNEWKLEMRPVSSKDIITPEMVERAKDSPIENMIEVTRGVARCISGEHDDKRPSMYVKNNKARCFSCGFHEDPISVAQKLYGITFHEAVRRLQ